MSDPESVPNEGQRSLFDRELAAFATAIADEIARIPEQVAQQTRWFAHFNRGGDKPPIYWCFNNWSEAVFLGHWLGPRQPLFAMRSLHGIVKGKAVKKLHTLLVAETYAAHVLEQAGEQAIILGGNCQAAPIAEAMAHWIIAKTGKAPLLVTLEHQPFFCYPGYLIMLFGSHSENFNPFLKGEDAITEWQRKHQAASWGFIDAGHGKYFIEPAVHQLTGYLTRAAAVYTSTGSFDTGRVDVQSTIPEVQGSRGLENRRT